MKEELEMLAKVKDALKQGVGEGEVEIQDSMALLSMTIELHILKVLERIEEKLK